MSRFTRLGYGCLLIGLCSLACADEPWRADPKLVEAKMKNSRGFNYREADVPQYVLPDPLQTTRGQALTAEHWPQQREQLLQTFRDHVYGNRPETAYRVQFSTVAQRSGVFDGTVDAREVKITVLAGEGEYSFSLLLFVPRRPNSGDAAKLPAIVHLNNRDFPTLDSAINESSEFWPVRAICDEGFVAAAVSTHEIDPDKAGRFEDGIRGFLSKASGASGEKPADPHAWAALSAWGWGVSRAVDYLLTLPTVDAERIAVVGHSRGGKAALWAAAEDTRIAIAYSNNSGCGGAALSRRRFGETVARITTAFPHWFCDRFATYADREQDLPVDQHQLIALLAPRAVYVASATDDLWADPRGEYLSLIHAAPVFQLLGHQAIDNRQMPAADQPRYVGRTGYHLRTGGHGLTPSDWQNFMRFIKQLED
ncbi:alpha/beta hydrolase [Roseimaritima ulvae]|uniref:4-O-methyl-glucuronoyl methylesterase-like domain-containing protein n=1 Tax=Roseimaritima ulvae TaxID=980254 RepID=A0A5B9QPN5_9BACT|nr:acetylxylan esterase [Roseimaritima ulvae]QEG41057.1 hypothetical protein UC8_30750 [Roseimaritima ulvae]